LQELLNKETTNYNCESQLFSKISITIKLIFHSNSNTWLVMRIEFEVFAPLTPKKEGKSSKSIWTLGSLAWKINEDQDRPLTYSIGLKC